MLLTLVSFLFPLTTYQNWRRGKETLLWICSLKQLPGEYRIFSSIQTNTHMPRGGSGYQLLEHKHSKGTNCFSGKKFTHPPSNPILTDSWYPGTKCIRPNWPPTPPFRPLLYTHPTHGLILHTIQQYTAVHHLFFYTHTHSLSPLFVAYSPSSRVLVDGRSQLICCMYSFVL